VSEQEQEVRRGRLESLREAGVDPYPARVEPFQGIASVRSAHDGKDEETLDKEAPQTAVVGRVRAKRSFGKLLFLEIEEAGSRLQLSARKGETPDEVFAGLKQVDVGDFLRVAGRVWRTKKGELTVAAEALALLSKSLRPLPEKWHGLSDVEARFRQRYLDLMANPRAREIAVLRSRAVSSVRTFLDEREFLEVETPVLQPLYGGAAARPFSTHHNTLDQQLYLRISDELYLKRLIVGGLDRVYEIGHNFRNEGISRKHNPEFTMMECYQAYADYHDMMDLAEALVKHVAQTALGRLEIEYQGESVDLSGSWPRVKLGDAVAAATGVDVFAADDLAALREALAAAGQPDVDSPTWAKAVDELFGRAVEPTLIQPTFITDYPAALSPLAKRSPEDPRIVERFELFLGGFELANAFSELNDPNDQRERFEEQRRAAATGDDEAHPMDEDYLAALEYGMPPTGGLGIGIDRLVMVLADAGNLREVILFPHLRPESS
jgi:lysyl-tRNA synthetase class 2